MIGVEKRKNVSDARLRDLERRFRDSNTLEDEVMWLTHRLNEGEVSAEDLELAALCGHEASRVVLAETFEPIVEFRDLMRSLVAHSVTVANRVVVIAAEIGLAHFEQAMPFDQRARTLMRELSIKVLNPRHHIEFEVATYMERVNNVIPDFKLFHAVGSVRGASITLMSDWSGRADQLTDRVMICVMDAANSASDEEVRTAICEHIIPWVLGYYDPLVDLIVRLQK